MSATLLATESIALATVDDETSLTLGVPTDMTDDELVGVVIQAFAKIRDYIPYIVELRMRFEAADRDSTNRLRVPISGCYTWKEFCTSILNRTPRNIWDACRDKKEKQEPRQLTDADVAAYEQEHPDIRRVTQKLLAQMTAADAIGALVGMETPLPIAEAVVRIVLAESDEPLAAGVSPEPVPAAVPDLNEFVESKFAAHGRVRESRRLPGRYELTMDGLTRTELRAAVLAAWDVRERDSQELLA